MSGKLLLDTNAVIALQASDKAFLALLDSDQELMIPAIVIGELIYGAYNSARVESNLEVIRELIEATTILDCDSATAAHYGQIKHQQKVKGRPIPDNDVWIAALTRQHDLTLVTRDEHFKMVDGLTLKVW